MERSGDKPQHVGVGYEVSTHPKKALGDLFLSVNLWGLAFTLPVSFFFPNKINYFKKDLIFKSI